MEAERAYNEEKIRRRSTKTSMTKNLKKLEISLQEFLELEELTLPDGWLVKIAIEIQQDTDAVKTN